MKKSAALAFPLLVVACLAGCDVGYKKVGGKWSYVTWDEANGRNVAPLDADDATFTVMKKGKYAKDKDRVYYRWVEIPGADPATFELLDDEDYAKDKEHVYYRQFQVIQADPATFRVIETPYGKDTADAYCGTVPMDVHNVDDFELVSEVRGISECSHRETFLRLYGDQLADLEISPDHPVVVADAWSRDGQHYYHGPSRVEGADYASFRIGEHGSASDKHRAYYRSFTADEWQERRARKAE